MIAPRPRAHLPLFGSPSPEVSLKIVHDYTDPGSYLTCELLHRCLDDLEGCEWLPLELRTPDRPPMDPAEAKWRELTEMIADEARALEVPFRTPDIVPHTRKAHELALHAGEADSDLPIHRALYRAHFVDGRDLGRIDELVGIAGDLGLEPSAVRTVLGVDRFLPRIRSLRTSLLDEGVRGTPTLVADDIRLEGYRGEREIQIFLSRIGLL